MWSFKAKPIKCHKTSSLTSAGFLACEAVITALLTRAWWGFFFFEFEFWHVKILVWKYKRLATIVLDCVALTKPLKHVYFSFWSVENKCTRNIFLQQTELTARPSFENLSSWQFKNFWKGGEGSTNIEWPTWDLIVPTCLEHTFWVMVSSFRIEIFPSRHTIYEFSRTPIRITVKLRMVEKGNSNIFYALSKGEGGQYLL